MSLIANNIQQLKGLCSILQGVSTTQYQQVADMPHTPTVGRHARHIIEHYAQLLRGLDEGIINYGLREREVRLEQCPNFAIDTMHTLESRLLELGSPFSHPLVLVSEGQRLATNLARELDYLFSHTVHHIAIIHILLQRAGFAIDCQADLHPSTQRHLKLCAQ